MSKLYSMLKLEEKVGKDKGGLELQFQEGWSDKASLRRWVDEKGRYEVLCQK